MEMTRDHFLCRLVDLQYTRNDIEFTRGQFRVRGDTVEVCPGSAEEGAADRILWRPDRAHHPLRSAHGRKTRAAARPSRFTRANNSSRPRRRLSAPSWRIREELSERIAWFEKHGKLLEAQRIKMRTEYDLEMMVEMGFCSGIENYSRHLSGRPPGSRPCTLFDFFPYGLSAGD